MGEKVRERERMKRMIEKVKERQRRLMERMREKVRERERRMMEETRSRSKRKWREKDLIRRMTFVTLNPFLLTISNLLDSIRVSIHPRCREFLMFAADGVKEAIQLLKSLENFREEMGRKRMEALEGEISEASLELENVLDSHVSDQFLSQFKTESIPLVGDERQSLLFSLNLRGIEQQIDDFIQVVMKMEKLLNPWLQEEEDGESDGGGKESDILGLSNQSKVYHVIRTLFISWLPQEEEEEISDDDSDAYGEEEDDDSDGGVSSKADVTRSWLISWFATKAASIFSGMKEDYIQDLQNLLPQKEEDHDYDVLFKTDTTTDFSRMVSKRRFRKMNGYLKIWWINKVAASLFVMEEDNSERLVNPLPEDDVDAVSSRTESAVNMVGSTQLFREIRDYLLQDFEEINNIKKIKLCLIHGMVGIGKTALAKKIIEDPLVSSKFECCIFVRLGPEYEWEETLQAIVGQMPGGDKMLMEEGMDLDNSVCKILEDRKCLVVLDDIWNRGPRDISDIIPWRSSQSAILFTARTKDAVNVAQFYGGRYYQVPFLNNEESWDLLRGKIFVEKRCSHELEKAGKIIAENCEGLPLLILAVAGLLSQAEETPDYWRKIAANKTNSIFVGAYEQV